MRRKLKEKPMKRQYSMYKCKPWFFWRQCCVCGDEVRRETVYVISITWRTKKAATDLCVALRSAPPSTDTYHFCSKCCASMATAENLFIKHWLPLYQ